MWTLMEFRLASDQRDKKEHLQVAVLVINWFLLILVVIFADHQYIWGKEIIFRTGSTRSEKVENCWLRSKLRTCLSTIEVYGGIDGLLQRVPCVRQSEKICECRITVIRLCGQNVSNFGETNPVGYTYRKETWAQPKTKWRDTILTWLGPVLVKSLQKCQRLLKMFFQHFATIWGCCSCDPAESTNGCEKWL